MSCSFGGAGVAHGDCYGCAYPGCTARICTSDCADAVVPIHGWPCECGCGGYFCPRCRSRHENEAHDGPRSACFSRANGNASFSALRTSCEAAVTGRMETRMSGEVAESLSGFLNEVVPGSEALLEVLAGEDSRDDFFIDHRTWGMIDASRVRFLPRFFSDSTLARIAALAGWKAGHIHAADRMRTIFAWPDDPDLERSLASLEHWVRGRSAGPDVDLLAATLLPEHATRAKDWLDFAFMEEVPTTAEEVAGWLTGTLVPA